MKKDWKEIICNEVKNCSSCPIFKPANICLAIKLNDELGKVLETEEFKDLSRDWKEKIKRRLEEEVDV